MEPLKVLLSLKISTMGNLVALDLSHLKTKRLLKIWFKTWELIISMEERLILDLLSQSSKIVISQFQWFLEEVVMPQEEEWVAVDLQVVLLWFQNMEIKILKEAAEEAAENHTKKGHEVKIDSEAVAKEAVIIVETTVMKETITVEIEEDKTSMTEELVEKESIEEKVDETNTDLNLRAHKNLPHLSRIEETETSGAHTTALLANPRRKSQRTTGLLNLNLRNRKKVPQWKIDLDLDRIDDVSLKLI